jgi:hypothetical protein
MIVIEVIESVVEVWIIYIYSWSESKLAKISYCLVFGAIVAILNFEVIKIVREIKQI